MRLLSIVTKLFLDTNRQHEPYLIAIPVQATEEIEKIAAGYNVEVVRIRNSHGAMMEATKDDRSSVRWRYARRFHLSRIPSGL
ncbi:MAG: hypothetical protein IPM83_16050 [Ignavibacteria bacterium]|nr:hypothetical protein [Ignavibacteria bacterium]